MHSGAARACLAMQCSSCCGDPDPSSPPPNCSVKEGATKEVLGILVSYRVKVKLVVSRGG